MSSTETQRDKIRGRNVVGLVAIFFAGVAFILEATATNLILPSLADPDGLAASAAGTSWIVSGVSVAMAVALIPAGRLGDILCQRRLFAAGAAPFALTGTAVGSVLVIFIDDRHGFPVRVRGGHGVGDDPVAAVGGAGPDFVRDGCH